MQPTSKYFYPGTNILINKANIRDREQLQHYEKLMTMDRLVELEKKPIYGNFDLNHLQKIHRYIFQDVYPFAGQLREVDIAKNDYRFLSYTKLQASGQKVFQSLKDQNHLKGLTVGDFSQKAARYLAAVNVMHPFREGNGRAQREFIRTLALNAGYKLIWNRVEKETLFVAMIESTKNPQLLGQVLESTIVNRQPDQSLSRFYQNLNQTDLER